ncbi:phosphotransferase enzyme family protein [Paenibacillus gallinarum]|uniref:Phosphotransferase n=1 Tax=Paenibacillus gallinarum TaxID=2762232 RepID=A0ABR8T1B9_9BACL|nr:phosphotransferase [Paenibacillus gallinarum]MBD7969560.1 phosphotransferase [Paenibacillus gallinarum]
MAKGFQMDTEINRNDTLKQTKQAALHALQKYEINWNSIHFIQISEHVTFRIAADQGESFLLRIHSAGKNPKEISSELEWTSAMKSKGITLPVAVRNREGSLVTTAYTDDGKQYYATLLTWVEGERLEKGEHTEETIQKMGELMAHLHKASTDFSPSTDFSRPSWGIHTFERDWAHLQLNHGHFISNEALELYSMAAEKVTELLKTLTSHEHDFGMIHADLHNGNIVFFEGEPYPIDFGRCGFGYHLYDIAQSILGLFPPQRVLFMKGYERIRQLHGEYIPKLEAFFIMALIEAYSFHADDSAEWDGLIEEQPYAEAILKAYLNDSSFLFVPLEISS